jgi:hypothetical protein
MILPSFLLPDLEYEWTVSCKVSRLKASYHLLDGFMSFFDSYGNSLGGADWEDQVGLISFAA